MSDSPQETLRRTIDPANSAPPSPRANSPANVKWFGALGDGYQQEAAHINETIDFVSAVGGGTVFVPRGTYLVSGIVGQRILLKSNVTLVFEAGCAINTGVPASSSIPILIDTANQAAISSVRILGNGLVITGDRSTATVCYGIFINAQTAGDTLRDVYISDILIKNCRTDGITVGGNTGLVPENIVFERIICDNCYRNGGSLIQSKYVTFRDCWFKNTNGTAPQAGFDIEPNAGLIVSDTTFINCRFSSNTGNGLYVQASASTTTERTNLIGCCFESNTGNGLNALLITGLRVTGCLSRNNSTGFFISNVDHCEMVGNVSHTNSANGYSLTGNNTLSGSGNCAHNNGAIGFNYDTNRSGTISMAGGSSYLNTTKGISFNRCSNVAVTGCNVARNTEDGVQFTNAHNNTLAGCFIAENGQIGDAAADNIIIEAASAYNNIGNNQVRQSRNFHHGTAQSGGAATVTLAATAQAATDEFYTGMTARIISGTGSGGSRVITGYVAATRVATVASNWSTPPDNTSVIEVASAIRPRYGIRVAVGTTANKVTDNDVYYGGTTGTVSDGGTSTVTTSANRTS